MASWYYEVTQESEIFCVTSKKVKESFPHQPNNEAIRSDRMDDLAHKIWKMCGSKKKYVNMEAAKKKAEKHNQYLYKCQYCKGIHLTKKRTFIKEEKLVSKINAAVSKAMQQFD